LLLTAPSAHGKGAGFNSHRSIEARPLAIPELGAKQVCPNCQAKFYDLNKRPAHCPKCATEFDPDEAVRSRRVRARAAPVDHELDDEREDQVRAKNEDAEDEEEEEVVTPALDEAVDEPVLLSDDDDEDGEPVAAPEDELAGFSEEEDLEDEDDADVPFLEEDEDDDFDDTEIDGLPGEGDEEDR
jgi:uncharacterized protein (TIGR02300 family)